MSLRMIVKLLGFGIGMVGLGLITACASMHPPSLAEIKNRPERQLASYNGGVSLPLAKRLLDTPPLILDYLKQMDSRPDYSSHILTEPEKQLFWEYFQLLPATFQDQITKKVVAIYFIDNLLGGGMSDFLFDQKGNLFLAMYFNPKILHASLSDWISYRDNSCFSPDQSGVTIQADCGSGYFALIHTLVHESAHVYDYSVHGTPFVEPMLSSLGGPGLDSGFTQGVWAAYAKPVANCDFPDRTNISGYGLGKQLPVLSAVALYGDLNSSPFSSLYGSSNWAEDFAETITWEWLDTKLHIPYLVSIKKADKLLVQFSPSGHTAVTDRYNWLKSIIQ